MGSAPRCAAALGAALSLLAALACGASSSDGEAPPPAPVGAGAPPPEAGETEAEADADPAAERAAEEIAAEVLSPSVTSAPEERVVPLESLLRPPAPKPAPRPRVIDLRDPEESPAAGAAESGDPGLTDAVRERVRVEHRSERIGRVGPDQGKYSETEAGVDVPVGEGVKIRGGVRVEERDEPAEERLERESTPRVGVEIEF